MRRLLTRTLPLLVVAGGALAFGIYEAGAAHRDQRAIVLRYATAWDHGDYTAMYNLLSDGSKRRISRTEFAAELQGAMQIATASRLHLVRVLSIGNGQARIRYRIDTSVFGQLHEVSTLPLTGSGGGTRVVFGTSLLFPGVRPGELLSRRSVLGKRGTLLASNGQVLAAGRTLTTAVPEAAGEIAGTLGRIPASQATTYAREGYPPNARVGLDGLERSFQDQLAGRLGGELLAGTRVLANVPAGNGTTVKTTINPELEDEVIQALGNHYAGMTVMDPQTGGVEAAAGIAFQSLQPPGSTFKIVTATAALQEGLTTLSTTYPYARTADIGGFTLQNADKESCGGTLIEAFAQSCDTTFAPIGIEVGAEKLVTTAQLFGFNEPSGIPGATTGTIPSAGLIGGATAVGESAIGQGLVQATTLGMADVAATIANRGERPVPTMLDGATPRLVHVTTAKIAGEVQQMMEAVVEYGTGTAAAIPGVTVAGKTGTAELANTAGKKNDAKETDAWFVAYAPAQDPKVVVAALFPSAGYGGTTAAPAVRQVLEDALGIG